MKIDRSTSVEEACQLVSTGKLAAAERLIVSEYPFVPVQSIRRSYTSSTATKVFVRDGFIDRYRGERLVFPAALRLLSHYLPQAFPFQGHWKMSECHAAYWDLCATIDHVVPVALGGTDSDDNLVSCSMLTNSIKSNFTLKQLEWQPQPAGSLSEWDGLLGWFNRQVVSDPSVLQDFYIERWHNAAVSVRA